MKDSGINETQNFHPLLNKINFLLPNFGQTLEDTYLSLSDFQELKNIAQERLKEKVFLFFLLMGF